MKELKNIVDIIQELVIIVATIFTARWTYKTFAHREKLDELKKLKDLIIMYYQKVQLYCMQVRESEEPDKKELMELLELSQIHNKILRLKEINLYTKPEVRANIQKIVGRWITDNERIKAMKSLKNMEERTKAWTEFENEYNKVKKMIDQEAGRLI